MAWRFSVYLLPTLAAGCVTTVLAAYAWRKRDKRAALPFTVLMVGLSIWSLAYGIELGFTDLAPMLFWDRVAFVGSVVVPTAWVLLAVEYAGYGEWITRRRASVLAVEPAVVLVLVWTNGFHGLIWRRVSLDSTGPITAPRIAFGPGYWANLGYSYLLLFVGIALLVWVMVRASRLHRRQSFVMLLGALPPLGVNAVFNVAPRLNPVGTLDLTTFAFAISGIFFALALFRFRMLGLAPVARETLVEGMDDGIVVLDAEERIVDLNPAARRALGDIEGERCSRTAIGPPDDVEGDVVSFDVGETTRSYEVSTRPLTDFRDETAGRLILLRDITTLQVVRDHEQRLSVVNRILRHNIRNELTVVAGRSELLLDDLSDGHREHVEAIDAAASRILAISEKARHVQATLGSERTNDTATDVTEVVTDTAAGLAETHPAAAVHVDVPATAWASTIGADQLAVAVENVGRNAITHNPADGASVWLRVQTRRRTVRITVRDDGPGIPASEVAAIERDRETALEHGSGLGLWLTRWIVDASGGELSVETAASTGSAIAIDLPRIERPGDGSDA